VSLNPGTRLGPYEVTGSLGAGGMGEVYRARDARLKRDVALKILPVSFAMDADRLARFQREAEVLASLNHPNIAAIYGLEEGSVEAGPHMRALVMELVEGETLADRIARGPIPVDEALPIAKQITEALEAAHEQGIIHRDLKPANIKVRPDGTVKVLDFGLAKLGEPRGSGQQAPGGALSMSPTITSPAMTGVGMLLGTAAYMSPEQARGKVADKRSDIWAFACVLYEMLTGHRAFDGEDVTDTLAAVMRSEPKWERLPDAISPSLRVFLRRCLHKDSKQRVGDIRDVRLALEGAFETGAPQVASPIAAGYPSGWRSVAMLTASALLIGAVIAGAAVWIAVRPAAARVVRTEITTSDAAGLSVTGPGRDVVVTPDGSRIVYHTAGQIFVRAVNQLDPTPLSDAGNTQGLFVSPDGQWVGFFEGTLLKKVAITGGPPVTLCDIKGLGLGATWGGDGTIIFSGGEPGLKRVSAAGGAPAVLTKPKREAGELDHRYPEFLPTRQAVLFTIWPVAASGADDAQIAVLDLRSGTQKVLVRGGSHARYVPTGHLVYRVGGTLRAVAFDLERLEVTGTPVPVVPQLLTKQGGAADFDVAENGMLVYVAGSAPREATAPRRRLVWVDRQGREEFLEAPERAYLYPRMSPDGTRVAVAISDQQADIWVWDLTRKTLTRTTFDPAPDSYPVWTPDSRRVIFGSPRGGQPNLFWQPADGTGAAERLTESSYNQQAFSISPDGSRLVFREGLPPYDLNVLLVGTDRRREPLLRTPFNEGNAEVSPDGRWLAYESNESGRNDVYVRPFPDVNAGRWQVSTAGGSRPLWARNGQELFYVGEDAALMSVRVQRGTTWTATTPLMLFTGQQFFFGDAPGQLGQGRTYDIARDGRRFLMIKEGSADGARPTNSIVVVQNWFEELKRLVPTQ